MPKKYDSNALWVSINERGERDLFHVYPKILAEILHQDDETRIPGDTSAAEKLVLPSDWDWREQNYFMLVNMQKRLDLPSLEYDVKSVGEGVQLVESEQVEEWAPWRLVVSMSNPNAPAPVTVRSTQVGRPWDMSHVIKAGKLLMKPPRNVEFADEHEMRNVYSVIYDVFRYKAILNQAIDDVAFFANYSPFYEYRPIVWLFLMELARRRWESRTRGELETINHQLAEAGFPFEGIEQGIWKERVHFAAAISRVRIKNHAFDLSELLPAHLREEKAGTCVLKETFTGWVNTFKAKKIAALVHSLHRMGYSYSNSRILCAGEYRFDRVCPRFITLRPPADHNPGQLDLVKDGIIVLQEREFCEGASTLCRALRERDLRGVVAQTHASSPRCSAYLAAQLRELAAVLKAKSPAAPVTPELGKLVVFGAGEKVDSYVESLRLMGIEASVAPPPEDSSPVSVCVYSESVHCETPNITNALDGVVAVLATPPNSYSAVSDPIDLVCGRGGDLDMLEVLTETKIDKKGEARVQSILEEQKKTLKSLLSKPQIQLILYETHSSLEAENQAQVTRAVAEANRLAREKHALTRKKSAKEQPASAKPKDRIEIPNPPSHYTISCTTFLSDEDQQEQSEKGSEMEEDASCAKKLRPLGSNENFVLKKLNDSKDPHKHAASTSKAKPIPEIQILPESQYPKDPDMDSVNVVVPNCDLFEIGKLPPIGNGLDINFILDRDGCYLGLIQRKEITRLDARFMIKVAEDRGLFDGAPVSAIPRRRKPDANTTAPRRRRRKTSGFEVERVAAPTYSSMVRSRRDMNAYAAVPGVNVSNNEKHICEKHIRRQAAASAAATSSCVCDAHHRPATVPRRTRRASAPLEPPLSPAHACRRPFPVVVHELEFRTLTQHKVFVS